MLCLHNIFNGITMEFDNNLNRSIQKAAVFPEFLRSKIISFMIGKTVKLVGTAGIRFNKLSCHEVIASLPNHPKVHNHLAQVHAAASALLAETATGILVGMNIPDHSLPLMKHFSVRFTRRSSGAQRAVATLTDGQIRLIRETEQGDIQVPVKVTDESGEEVILAEMLWAWVPKKKK